MLDKAIRSGKEKRKPYHGAKAVSLQCRNHGGCEWCRANRLKKDMVKEERMKAELKEYEVEEC